MIKRLLISAAVLLLAGCSANDSDQAVAGGSRPSTQVTTTTDPVIDLRIAAGQYLTAARNGDVATVSNYLRGTGCAPDRPAQARQQLAPSDLKIVYANAALEAAQVNGETGYTKFSGMITERDEQFWSKKASQWVINC